MILAAFQLYRDFHTENQTFGYLRSWSHIFRLYDQSKPDLGFPIELPVKITTQLVKIVEFYHREEDVVIERLAWRFGNDIYPFRLKYFRDDTKDYYTDPLIFLPNLGTIHQKITGLDVSFMSPLNYCLNVENHKSLLDPRNVNYLSYLRDNFQTTFEEISSQETDYTALRDFLSFLDSDRLIGIEQFFGPKLSVMEPISRQFLNKPLRSRNILFSGSGDNFFDTTPAQPLTISHPDITFYSPQQYHTIARTCEYLSAYYTDIKLEYILSERTIIGRIAHHVVSRYFSRYQTAIAEHYCDDIIIQFGCRAELEHPEWNTLYSEKVIVFQLTYGDEALIEVYTIDKKTCLFAVHLDLAMISLCSSGVIALPTIPVL